MNSDPRFTALVNYALKQRMSVAPQEFIWLQEREYKEALEAFNDKNKEKAQLVSKLVEVIRYYVSPYNTHLMMFN